jgi:hypothetical protein
MDTEVSPGQILGVGIIQANDLHGGASVLDQEFGQIPNALARTSRAGIHAADDVKQFHWFNPLRA